MESFQHSSPDKPTPTEQGPAWAVDTDGTVSSAEIANRLGRNHSAFMEFLAARADIESRPSESGETRRIPLDAIEPALQAFDDEQAKLHRTMFQ